MHKFRLVLFSLLVLSNTALAGEYTFCTNLLGLTSKMLEVINLLDGTDMTYQEMRAAVIDEIGDFDAGQFELDQEQLDQAVGAIGDHMDLVYLLRRSGYSNSEIEEMVVRSCLDN